MVCDAKDGRAARAAGRRWAGTLKLGLVVGASALTVASLALANPQGGEVVSGQATISAPSATRTTITQTSDKTVIDWKSFNIGAGESTVFVQPNSNSIALNRIFDNDPSVIAGLFQTRAAFEKPCVTRARMIRNAGEHPPEHVVFFDDIRVKPDLARELENFLPVDHVFGISANPAGTRMRHTVTRRSPGRFGSSLAFPAESRLRHCVMSSSSIGRNVAARYPRRLKTALFPSLSAYSMRSFGSRYSELK